MTDKDLFYKRIEEEYDDFLQEVEEYGPDEVMENSEKIADMKQIYEYLMRDKPIDDKALKHFMKLRQPLHTICEWYQEDKAPIYDTLNHTLWTIEDKEILDYKTNKESEQLKAIMLKEYEKGGTKYGIQSKIYVADELAKRVFSPDYCFDEYDAKVLMQFEKPFAVLLDNIEFGERSFKEDMEAVMYKLGGMDLLTCPYAVKSDAILPETRFRHDAINKIIDLVPKTDFDTTATWLDFHRTLSVDVAENFDLTDNPYEEFIEALDSVSFKYGKDIIQKVYDLGKTNTLVLEGEMVGAADYIADGGDISKIREMAENGEFEGYSTDGRRGGMDIC